MNSTFLHSSNKWRVLNIALAGIVFMDYFRYTIDIFLSADIVLQNRNNAFDLFMSLMCLILSIVNLGYHFKHLPPVRMYLFMMIFGTITLTINIVNKSMDISRAAAVYSGKSYTY